MTRPNIDMTPDEFRTFMHSEIAEMERHKWIESEKAGHDLGEDAILDWIKKHAADYRQYYNLMLLECKCRHN